MMYGVCKGCIAHNCVFFVNEPNSSGEANMFQYFHMSRPQQQINDLVSTMTRMDVYPVW